MFKRMPTEKVVYTSGGSSLLTAIAIVFVILKLTGTTAVATWSWWWVLAPLWDTCSLSYRYCISVTSNTADSCRNSSMF